MPVHDSHDGWVLETQSTGYALGPNKAGLVAHRYWGARLPGPAGYPSPPPTTEWAPFNSPAHLTREEYPAYAGAKYIDPCLKIIFADGVRDVVLRYDSAGRHAGDPSRLDVRLRDAYYPLSVTLHYRAHADYDLIERWVTITNAGQGPVTLERAWSVQWHVPPGAVYRLSHLAGRWFDEMHLYREHLLPGRKVLESRRLTTGHQHNPWFAVDQGQATEESGEIWFGVLAWSGNWKLSAEVDEFATTRLSLGLNDWDFAWRLGAGESFVTPSSYAGYTTEGFGGASRRLHDFIRDQLLPYGSTPHKIIYNSWEATQFDVDENTQIELAEIAAGMGIELFVMDDGWFNGRSSDRAGLGDWWPDRTKFPNGLRPLIRRVIELGMDFGLWVEPEMVNPDSDMYRLHPDWVIHFPTRARTEARHQLILNLARADVQDYLLSQLDKLLTENNIAFVKWDMNRNVSEPGWPDAEGDPRELWVRYVQGVYRVWGALRERHPGVMWQSCSGGGGRADLGILRLADQVWVSDNTEATARLAIQEGYSQVFPAITMEAWVTDLGQENVPLEFRFHASMCGALGVGGNLVRWSAAQRAEAARWIARYKEIRPIVQTGHLFRLRSAQAHNFSALEYMSPDWSEGVLFAFRTHLPEPATLPALRLQGLEPQAQYQLEGVADARSGLAWMQAGLTLGLKDFQSTVRHIRRVRP